VNQNRLARQWLLPKEGRDGILEPSFDKTDAMIADCRSKPLPVERKLWMLLPGVRQALKAVKPKKPRLWTLKIFHKIYYTISMGYTKLQVCKRSVYSYMIYCTIIKIRLIV
jgi:hypothetical protein